MTTDISKFDDPVAARTEWKPIKAKGNAFFIHELHEVAPHRFELRAVASTKRTFQALIIVGILVLVAFMLRLMLRGFAGLSSEAVAIPMIGITLVAIGWGMIRLEMVPVVFDTRMDWYWKGTTDPQATWSDVTPDNSLRINEIYALQIIAKTWSGRSNRLQDFTSYEMNLVRKDGKRLNVTDHGNLSALKAQAHALADLLHKPLWDASDTVVNLDD